MAVRPKPIIIVIILQSAVILYLGASILAKLKPSVSLNPIPAGSIQRNVSSMMAHYYEPLAGETVTDRKSWMMKEAVYTINRDGLNERFDYPVERKPGTYRIVVLGDSFTYGTNVSTGDNWTELLEDLLNRSNRCTGISSYEVINLGVGGYDIPFESERYRRKGAKYKADLLVWHITDIYRLTGEMLPQLKLTTEEKKEGAFLPKWLDIRRNTLQAHGRETILKFHRDIVRETVQDAAGNIIFIDNPIPYRDEPVKGIREARIVSAENVVFTPSFSIGDAAYSLKDQHYNEAGHRKFAQEFAHFLDSEGLIPCRK